MRGATIKIPTVQVLFQRKWTYKLRVLRNYYKRWCAHVVTVGSKETGYNGTN